MIPKDCFVSKILHKKKLQLTVWMKTQHNPISRLLSQPHHLHLCI